MKAYHFAEKVEDSRRQLLRVLKRIEEHQKEYAKALEKEWSEKLEYPVTFMFHEPSTEDQHWTFYGVMQLKFAEQLTETDPAYSNSKEVEAKISKFFKKADFMSTYWRFTVEVPFDQYYDSTEYSDRDGNLNCIGDSAVIVAATFLNSEKEERGEDLGFTKEELIKKVSKQYRVKPTQAEDRVDHVIRWNLFEPREDGKFVYVGIKDKQ